jgi:exonuclease SbcC
VEAACKRRLEEQDGRAMEAGEQAASTIRQLDQKRSGQSLQDSRIKERQIRLDGQEAAWLSRLAQADFSAEEDFLAARLTPADLSSLQKQIEEIDRSTADRRIRTADRQRQHEQLLAENRTAESLAALQERRQFLENERKTVQQRIGEYQSRWEANCAAQEKVQTLGEQFGRQQTECRKWDRLELLIGSADGKKYRNFAQGLTFECMVAKANQQLMQMTDRYLLVRDQTEPLLLNVIDNYQAGEIRTTRNLSGGESFLVSLALALGLSRLASRNVQVDTLFLDEGFGTLDEETLETALETLASLQMENKLIGVISHVPALKERISTQVRVLNRAGGKSTLAGPGVERVNHPA